ncbi:hypothetical protein BN946_scf185042.g121 [Trametes cinnabarina]|uniref:Uncharacterized protein n=1 Tax=Pycnoporus cinnabarinus TaxID=5643 RepID=A0A060SAA2_PYCCI|nr:hypothetical protein BN946_scf185042.g121 [Trametes cinnabarina]
MTEKSRLYLDVDEFDVLGSPGEPMWGSPVDIGQDANIREWMEGLRQDGGGGNVLKLRKERMAARTAQQQLQAEAHHHQVTMDSAELKRLHANMMKYFRPPDDIFERLMQLSGAVRDSGAIHLRQHMHIPHLRTGKQGYTFHGL